MKINRRNSFTRVYTNKKLCLAYKRNIKKFQNPYRLHTLAMKSCISQCTRGTSQYFISSYKQSKLKVKRKSRHHIDEIELFIIFGIQRMLGMALNRELCDNQNI